jgi:hypothetical protein
MNALKKSSPFTPKHSSVIQTLHKKLMKGGKSNTAERIFKKAVNTAYVVSRKSNPYMEFTYKVEFLSKRNRGHMSSIVVTRKGKHGDSIERLFLNAPNTKIEKIEK